MCANELLHRTALIQKMVPGWDTADSFRLHETVPVSGRIGKDPSTIPAAAAELNSSQAILPTLASTQDSAPSASAPLEESIVGVINVSPPGDLPVEHT